MPINKAYPFSVSVRQPPAGKIEKRYPWPDLAVSANSDRCLTMRDIK
jgi:hypothetical protein